MSHFAQIDENNVVIQVIVAEQDFIDSGVMGDPSTWIQTSYTNSIRNRNRRGSNRNRNSSKPLLTYSTLLNSTSGTFQGPNSSACSNYSNSNKSRKGGNSRQYSNNLSKIGNAGRKFY